MIATCKKIYRWTFVLLLSLSFVPLYAQSFYQVGAEVKGAAGAGITQSRNYTALEYNPSNLNYTRGNAIKTDFSFLNVSYQYLPLPKNQKKVSIDVNTPTFTLGYTHRYNQTLVLGIGLVPTGAGQEMEIQNLPIQVGGSSALVTAKNKNTGFKLSSGLSWASGKSFILGLSLQYMSESTETKVSSAEGATVIDSTADGQFFRPIFGAKLNKFKKRLSIGATIKLPLKKTYRGRVISSLISGGEASPSNKIDYLPWEVGFGFSLKLKYLELFQEVNYLRYSGGRYSQNRGYLQPSGAATDLNDVINAHMGGRYKWSKQYCMSLAYGYYPSNIGQGLTLQEDGTEETISLGPSFGDMQALDRSVFAAGLSYKPKSAFLHQLSLQHTTGRRTINASSSGPGVYLLSIWELGIGTTFRF